MFVFEIEREREKGSGEGEDEDDKDSIFFSLNTLKKKERKKHNEIVFYNIDDHPLRLEFRLNDNDFCLIAS